jgi:hypothetical protein
VGGWGSSQCCQMAEIPAKKITQKGPEKKKSWPEEFAAKNWQNIFYVLLGK